MSLILLRINQDISEEKRKYSNLFLLDIPMPNYRERYAKRWLHCFYSPCIRLVYFYYVCTACEQQNQPSASHSDFWSNIAIRCSPIWLLPGGNKDIGQTIFQIKGGQDIMDFSEKLLTLRQANDMTQEQLAEKLDVSRQSISKWESGQATPNWKNSGNERGFNVTTDYLLKVIGNRRLVSKNGNAGKTAADDAWAGAKTATGI